MHNDAIWGTFTLVGGFVISKISNLLLFSMEPSLHLMMTYSELYLEMKFEPNHN